MDTEMPRTRAAAAAIWGPGAGSVLDNDVSGWRWQLQQIAAALIVVAQSAAINCSVTNAYPVIRHEAKSVRRAATNLRVP